MPLCTVTYATFLFGSRFADFRLDQDGRLWRGNEQLKLTAKASAILQYLAVHADTVVSKTMLFEEFWSGVIVTDWALTTCIRELRRVLEDEAKTPRIIETVHRRGYRFIGKVVSSQQSVASGEEENQKLNRKRQK